ncbi:hypothetical protein BV25DRAFT_1338917 [Artomyces pyxidatus]|uniref:Uncharacterized protein n=1 Tax=Artomyces pyxidatus TaxID=48021 RepID=A0ACB8SN64_9AGAM|nr:hypothetical protein BV25DRAFT_1338917 [Artomyces pyxidatus]
MAAFPSSGGSSRSDFGLQSEKEFDWLPNWAVLGGQLYPDGVTRAYRRVLRYRLNSRCSSGVIDSFSDMPVAAEVVGLLFWLSLVIACLHGKITRLYSSLLCTTSSYPPMVHYRHER